MLRYRSATQAHPTPTKFYVIDPPIGSPGLRPFCISACPEKTQLTRRTDPVPGPVNEAPTTAGHGRKGLAMAERGWPIFMITPARVRTRTSAPAWVMGSREALGAHHK